MVSALELMAIARMMEKGIIEMTEKRIPYQAHLFLVKKVRPTTNYKLLSEHVAVFGDVDDQINHSGGLRHTLATM